MNVPFSAVMVAAVALSLRARVRLTAPCQVRLAERQRSKLGLVSSGGRQSRRIRGRGKARLAHARVGSKKFGAVTETHV